MHETIWTIIADFIQHSSPWTLTLYATAVGATLTWLYTRWNECLVLLLSVCIYSIPTMMAYMR